MKYSYLAPAVSLIALVIFGTGCNTEKPSSEVQAVLNQPKEYVGSDTCKTCHLEHYDSWRMTMHSRMAQDAKANQDAIIVDIDEKRIRSDLAKLGDKLKIPAEEIWIPQKADILYTIGSQWKQRYIVKKDGTLYISPIQYNVETDRWVPYHEHDWQKRPWILKCGGCHTTGANIEKQSFIEPSVGCEACHGKGSWHAALPKSQVFKKRTTIINPAKLTPTVAVQICGSCHNRGKSTKVKGAGWPVGYEPGKALESFYQSTSYAAGDKKHMYENEFSKGHHQQYIDWIKTEHRREGVNCTSCHNVHQIGMPQSRAMTSAAGSKQCLLCHQQVNQNQAHAIHSFANCVGCHMPRIAKSAESGDIHSHVFRTLTPADTIKNPKIPNSCQNCHKHKDEDINKLNQRWQVLTQLPKPKGKAIEPVSEY